MSGKQELPEKFRVTQSNTADAPQDIYINREIHTGVLALEGKVGMLKLQEILPAFCKMIPLNMTEAHKSPVSYTQRCMRS